MNPEIFPFFETIRVQDGFIEGFGRHLSRMRQTCQHSFGVFHHENIISGIAVPQKHIAGLVKLNIFYNRDSFEVRFSPYTPMPIQNIVVVECRPDFDYSYKFTNREYLNELLSSVPGADEIIIIKNGHVTDTSKANIVFEKDHKYYTPDTCLLNGTMRQHLIRSKRIFEKAMRAEDVFSYEKMYFINALNPLETAMALSCKMVESIN